MHKHKSLMILMRNRFIYSNIVNSSVELDREMKEEPLPLERIEFEDRARLFALIRLLEEFLNIKKEFMKEYSNGIDSQRVIKA